MLHADGVAGSAAKGVEAALRQGIKESLKLAFGRERSERVRGLANPFQGRHDLRLLQQAKARYQAFLQERLRRRQITLPSTPVPPAALLAKMASRDEQSFERRFEVGSNEARYDTAGYETWLAWFTLAERQGFALRKVDSVFELGCGTAPLLRHLVGVIGSRLVACDLDPEMVAWCRQNVPGPAYHLNDLAPPLRFAGDAEFDLVYADAVFTRIPLDMQPAWIEELARVTRPGGWCLCTVASKGEQQRLLSSGQRRRLAAEGHVEIASEDEGASPATEVGDWNRAVYQKREAVARNFARFLDVVACAETHGQDLIIAKKPAT